MTAKAIPVLPNRAVFAGMATFSATMSGTPSEQSGRADQQYDRHDDEDHRIRRFRKEHLGQSLDNSEAKSGDDRAEDGTHAADHHHGEHHNDELGAHLRADIVDR